MSHQAPVIASSVSPDGQDLATLGLDESLRIWHLFEKVEDHDDVQ